MSGGWVTLLLLMALDFGFVLASQRFGTLRAQALLSVGRAQAALWITGSDSRDLLTLAAVGCMGIALSVWVPVVLPLLILPLWEEVFFRGAVLQLDLDLGGWLGRVALSSLWFGSNHGMEGALPRLLRALVYCLVELHFGLAGAIAAHVFVNVSIRLWAQLNEPASHAHQHVPQRHVVKM
jgi:membrane protease YdiL (CAAX protease family)